KQARGGDLRIMYPAPEVCLDLKSWREFYGFDQTGCEGWFEIEMDTKALTLEFKKSQTTPPGFGPVDPERYAYDPGQLRKVEADGRVSLDLLGSERSEDAVFPGPFAKPEFGRVYSVDPRIMEETAK
ncbi:MAG: right-handed parallel beta-helix repeat-containing protein, partial [Lachnospiraceae bacterium]|nr:right-handed parallel beta-helix repeat-containing protein [Lachnospiraceae bacterium]